MSIEDEFERLHRSIDGLEGQAFRKISREFAKSLEGLRNIVRDKYDQHAEEGSLTQSVMAKYNRREKLDKELREAARDVHVKVSKLTREELRQTYRKSFNGTRDIISSEAGRTIQGKVKREVVQEALQNPVSGLKLNDRLRRRRQDIVTEIQETVGQGIYRGESYSSMSNRLKETLDGNNKKARRIVRTETHRVQEQAKKHSLDHAHNQGVKMRKWWMTSDDEKVRAGHEHMGDKYSKENAIPYEENFVNDETGGEGPAPGLLGVAEDDINCRCRKMIIVVDTS